MLVYELNSRLIALDYDCNSIVYKTKKPSLYLLGENQQVHLIENTVDDDGY